MMMQMSLEQEAFKRLLDECRKEVSSQSAIERLRQKAWDHFLSIGLPTRSHEAYRYLKLRQLFAQPYQQACETQLSAARIAPWINPECRRSVLVFVNGYFSPHLSCTDALPLKMEVLPLEEAVVTFGAFLNNQWSKSLKDESDPFAALNGALHRKGVFIYVPPQCVVESPVQILHVMDQNDQLQMAMPRVQIFLGAQSHLNVVQVQKHSSDTGYFVNQATDVSLEEGAQLHYTQALSDEHPSAWHFDAFRAVLKRDSRLKTVCVTTGSATVRADYRIALAGENAECLLNGVAMLSEKCESHMHIFMEHQAPYCRSFQLFKNVLSDFSRSSFEGKIMVRRPAQKTEAFQLNNNLILNDHAHADSKPNLEIFADDVKASHGATVGQLDAEQLFYMKTRGFAEEEAKNLLIYGFCEQVIEMIELPSLREEVANRARRYLKRG